MTDDGVEDLLRDLAPRVLGRLVRRHGDLATCEDAVQEALLAAAVQWPRDGRPASPQGWLTTVASRRLVEFVRNESARRRREVAVVVAEPDPPPPGAEEDDSLTLLLLCCHPALSPPAQVTLTLRAVGGLTTAEIARALLVPEPTVAQRISRAKQRVRAAGARFELPPPERLAERVREVLQVLYLIFNEGYTASAGPALQRVELAAEAIRLTRQLHARLPEDGEAAGLLALMLLTDARRPARTGPDGELVPLAEQDRSRWLSAPIAEGADLLTRTLASGRPVGPYQLQAAIAAVHDEAPSAAETDWPQILGLYDLLDAAAPSPVVTLNRAVAVAMVHGPRAGLAALADAEGALAGNHRLDAVRGHLLQMAGEPEAAREHYARAARRTLSIPERRYLLVRAAAGVLERSHE